MKKKKISVAVTGLNAIDSPGPGVPVIRALKESKIYDVRIIGLSYETLEPGIYMHDSVDKTDVIIPNFDAELQNFISLTDTLKKKMGIHTFLPTMDQFEARHKSNLPEYGKKHKIDVPY